MRVILLVLGAALLYGLSSRLFELFALQLFHCFLLA